MKTNDVFQAPAGILGPEIDWKPDFLRPSAWLQHVPFAFWIVKACQPRTFVELGTHTGVSYFSFCQAVERLGLSTNCFAVDTWQGDEHAGHYGEDIFSDVRSTSDRKYRSFSNLLRTTFDDASSYFADGEIDLLHIDGLHTYDAVAHDFRTWKPKLSKKAVVLFHDINVREREFGVWQLWEELTKIYPSFRFNHGYGLGVLGVGEDLPAAVRGLFDNARLSPPGQPSEDALIRTAFAVRGESVLNLYELNNVATQLHALQVSSAQSGLADKELEPRDLGPSQEDTLQQRLDEALLDLDQMRERAVAAQHLAGKLEAELLPLKRRTMSFRWKRFLRSVDKRLPRKLRNRLIKVEALQPVLGFSGDLKLAVLPAAKRINVVWIGGEPDTPGYRYRVVYWAAAAKAAGINVSYHRLDEFDRYQASITAAHAVILWRAQWSETVEKLVRATRDAGARLVFDVDDLMFDPSLAKVEVIDGIRSQSLTEQQVKDFYGRVQQTMLAADVCTASTEELAQHFRFMGKPAFVLPNGFDEEVFRVSRLAARKRGREQSDQCFRIGYAGGSKTHQRDFGVCAPALIKVLKNHTSTRLVLFKDRHGTPLVDLSEFPELLLLSDKVEWRQLVPLNELPNEIARFDVNLAPLEVGNVFCEAKSELKFFEAALTGVCTVASPTGPYARAIRHNETGLLATSADEWYDAIVRLIESPALQASMAREALRDVLWTFGPDRRADIASSVLDQIVFGGRTAARAFAASVGKTKVAHGTLAIPEWSVEFEHDRLIASEVTVIIPLHNYENFIVEALRSVKNQTLRDIDLIVVDDASTDASFQTALRWCKGNAERFNRLLVVKNKTNAKLGPTRNVGFELAETAYVLPLDADNRLRPECAERCLTEIKRTGAAYVYPRIEAFGEKTYAMGDAPYDPVRFVAGNYIDAMALVSKSVWAAVGGYDNVPFGWEDYDFWCRIAELGIQGVSAGSEPLADYRVHGGSMLNTTSNLPSNHRAMVAYMQERHPWLSIAARYAE